jgi:hypothetical protein
MVNVKTSVEEINGKFKYSIYIDGEVHTRTSNKKYSHVIVKNDTYYNQDRWNIHGFSSNTVLAEKALATALKRVNTKEAFIVVL